MKSTKLSMTLYNYIKNSKHIKNKLKKLKWFKLLLFHCYIYIILCFEIVFDFLLILYPWVKQRKSFQLRHRYNWLSHKFVLNKKENNKQLVK